jgi:hypothetical protein
MADKTYRSRRQAVARVLRWSALAALVAVPVVVVVSAIAEPRLRPVENCSRSGICEVIYASQHRIGPTVILILAIWVVVAVIAATIIDRRRTVP